jgi:uncharacterized ion transporter superfamily protein YfcC
VIGAVTSTRQDDTTAEPKRRFKFPTAFTVLFFVLVPVWILTFVIRPGTYSCVSCDGGAPKPVIIGLGYDRPVGVGIIMVGAGVETLASTVNPFATGVASDAAGVALGDGIGLRLIMYAVMTTVAVLYVLQYARRVKSDPARSMVPASNIPLAFLVPSSSGHATRAMPIMAPIGDRPAGSAGLARPS